jgi:hypothetical protein
MKGEGQNLKVKNPAPRCGGEGSAKLPAKAEAVGIDLSGSSCPARELVTQISAIFLILILFSASGTPLLHRRQQL